MKCLWVSFLFLLSSSVFADANSIEEGSLFTVEKDIVMTLEDLTYYGELRYSVISKARGERSVELGASWETHTYSSMDCEIHAKRFSGQKKIRLPKGYQLEVERVISSRSDLGSWHYDDHERYNVIMSYFGRYGENKGFVDVKFNHPVIDKLFCVVPNTRNTEMPLWFFKRTIKPYFSIQLAKAEEDI